MTSKRPSCKSWESSAKRKRIRASWVYAARGIGEALQERHLRFHLVVAALTVAIGFYVRLSPNKWALLTLAIALVVITETLNTAIERVTDLASPSYAELARQAKDVAAGAVLLAALTSLVLGYIIFYPYLKEAPRAWRQWLVSLPTELILLVGLSSCAGFCREIWRRSQRFMSLGLSLLALLLIAGSLALFPTLLIAELAAIALFWLWLSYGWQYSWLFCLHAVVVVHLFVWVWSYFVKF